MRREIKFRAWDGTKIISYENGDSQPVYDSEGAMPDEIIHITHKINGLIWMQYTGLKDRNGVEIYEGDRFSYATKRGVRKQWVTFNDGAFGCIVPITDLPDKFVPLSTYLHRHDIEVIGNIWEKPEPLEVSQR